MDVSKVNGLLDIIAIGNIIEFAVALDYRTYQGPQPQDTEYLERDAAMTRYRTFITWFSDRYGLIIDGSWVNPSYLFKRRLICFAATLLDYFTREHLTVQQYDKLKGINPDAVKRVVRHHIQTSWADLLPAFDKLVHEPSSFLYHNGPPIRIIRKTPFRLAEENLMDRTEALDFDSTPLYNTAQEDLLPEYPAEKRSHFVTSDTRTVVSPPSSPSQQKVVKRRKQM